MTQNDIQKIFSKNLIKLLEEKGATQAELAKYIGVSSTTINNYVKGYNTPRMDKIDKICSFFNVSRDRLISENQTEQEESNIPELIAAHFEGGPLTEKELEELDQFLEFLKMKREQQKRK